MLCEHHDRIGPAELLLADRGYPCREVPATLSKRGVDFCMRVKRTGDAGFDCVRLVPAG